MAILELTRKRPDWQGALEVALTRPPGVPERRSGEDPWNPPARFSRPRRISDDLAWFRRALDDPAAHDLITMGDDMPVWESEAPEPIARLARLRERGVLQAAGFELHEPDRSSAA
jgi:hypothetical protein